MCLANINTSRSQFKAQLTAITGGPLPIAEEILKPYVESSIMVNILGGVRPDSHHMLVDKAKTMYGEHISTHVHLYGKESKPSRKIGHITITGNIPIQRLESFAKPLVDIAAEMRKERIHSTAVALRPEQASKPKSAPSAVKNPLVLVTMGSDSDLNVLKAGIDILHKFEVPYDIDITSAHRTPERMAQVGAAAADRGIKVIIAAAGGAAHLPGMLASHTTLPVIGVPVQATHLGGVDSLLSIVQMPVCFSLIFDDEKLTAHSAAYQRPRSVSATLPMPHYWLSAALGRLSRTLDGR